ncbi:MAG: DDE-type integrase/transposase/recombinase [Patescibacteria group bacterium]
MPSNMQTTQYDRQQRFRWYLQVDKYHKSVTETCQIFGISRKCYYKWRLRDYGKRGNRYLTAKNQPNTKLSYEVRKFIAEQKLKTNYGPLKMKMLVKKKLKLDISTTIIYRYYQRKNLIRKPQKRSPWYKPMKTSLVIKQAGEGVQMDVKYVYEEGARKYKFSVFDPYSRKYHFSIFNTKESRNSISAFKSAEKYFGFKIASVQTDNGSEARGEFHTWLTKNNTPHYFIPKSSPYWNCYVERVHRTIDDEYYLNTQRSWKTPYEWLHFYNFERIHLSLNGLTPQEKYLESVTPRC